MAAAGGFSVTVSLVDQATARLDDINKRLAALRAPAENFNKSLEKFGKVSGLDQIGHHLAGMGRAAVDLARSLTNIVAPLSLIGSAASLAGVYRLSEAFAGTAVRLANMGNRLGLSGSALSAFENAGRLASVPVEALDSGLKTLRDNMVLLASGQGGADLVVTFRALGFSMQDAARLAKDPIAAFSEVAERLKRIHDPTWRAKVATEQFGAATEALLPLLNMTREEFRRSMVLANAHGHVTERQIVLGRQLAGAQAGLSASVDDLSRRMVEKMSPALIQLLEWFTKVIDANKVDWAGWLGTKMGELVAWLQSPAFNDFIETIGGIGKGIVAVIGNVTDWKLALGAVLLVFAGPAIVTALAVLASIASGFRLITATSEAAGAAIAKTVGAASGGGLRSLLLGATPIGRAVLLTEQLMHMMSEAAKGQPGGSLLDRYARERFGPRTDPANQLEQRPILPGSMPYVPGFGGPSAPMPIPAQPAAAAGVRAANEVRAFDFWTSAAGGSRTPEVAAGMVARMHLESGGDPANIGDGGEARGLYQHHLDRRRDIQRGTGIDVATDMDVGHQLSGLAFEMRNKEKSASDRINEAKTAYDAGYNVSKYLIRPGLLPSTQEMEARRTGQYAVEHLADWQAKAAKLRSNVAEIAPQLAAPQVAATPPTTPAAAGAPAQLSPRVAEPAAATPLKGSAQITITHANAPPGSSITATTSGALFPDPPRFERSMPQAASP